MWQAAPVLRLFLLALLAVLAIPAHAEGWENATGPHPTTVVASAGPGGRYYIQRPVTLRANAWYAEREQQRHIGFAANPSIALFTRAWVYTQLFGDLGTARKCFYGPDWTLGKATGWKETLRNHSAPLRNKSEQSRKEIA